MHIYKNKITCTAYSSDGSIYEVTPESVIQVESAEDIRKAVRYALKQGKSITPRGGGTGLTGGALGDGVIIDFGRMISFSRPILPRATPARSAVCWQITHPEQGRSNMG